VIEPLRHEEDNLVNTVTAALEIAAAVSHPSVRVLADYYHMRSVGESMEVVRTAGNSMLRHCHIARLEGRSWPREDDGEDYSAFFRALADIGYDGRLSVEGRTESMDADAAASMAFLSRAAGRG